MGIYHQLADTLRVEEFAMLLIDVFAQCRHLLICANMFNRDVNGWRVSSFGNEQKNSPKEDDEEEWPQGILAQGEKPFWAY